MSKKSDNNSSFFEKSIDKYRAILQNIFIYGCYDQNLIAEKCGCSVEKVKDAKEFYDVCLADHLGINYMIKPEKTKGRPSAASYLNYQRFIQNSNFLYSAYLWSSTVKETLWRYTYMRQHINHFTDKEELCEKLTSLVSNHSDYFQYALSKNSKNINGQKCKGRNCESVKDFIRVCNENDPLSAVNSLCDALSVFARKAPYSVPAYSIIYKLRKTYNEFDETERFDRSEICDFTYDNYDRILHDDTVYSLIQAIWKHQIVSYSQSSEKNRKIYIIPLKILREYTSGREYLIHGDLNSETIHITRIDKIFKVKVYSFTDDEYRDSINQKIEKLNSILEKTIDDIWLTGKYTMKNKVLSVKLDNIDNTILSYIKKYAPNYKYSEAEKSIVFNLRKADDIKPFLRTVGRKAVISRTSNLPLYEEFAGDYSEADNIYKNIDLFAPCNSIQLRDDTKVIKNASKSNDEEKDYNDILKPDKKILNLFNKYNSLRIILVEELLVYLRKEMDNKSDPINISKILEEIFKKYGFNYYTSLRSRIVDGFVDDTQKLIDSEDYEDLVPITFDKVGKKTYVSMSIEDEEEYVTQEIPAQIFTDYEYEYLYLMIQNTEARAMLNDDLAEKMENILSDRFEGISLDDICITRFMNNYSLDIDRYHKAVVPVLNAIHGRKMISFSYKGKSMTCSPYRLTYSLRECVPRLIVKGESDWIQRINIDDMNNVIILEDTSLSDKEFEDILNKKKKYIELIIPKSEAAAEKNVFERALRLLSSYEKYTWDDQKNNAYAIAVVYYDFDITLRYGSNGRRIYRDDTIISDILSLGKYAVVLPENHDLRHKLPDECDDIEYDNDVFYYMRGIYENLNKNYNG